MTIIKCEDLPNFIRENFGKKIGVLACSNPHWWLHFEENHIAYEYECCEAENCDSYDYEIYTDVELLIKEKNSILTDSDDWLWSD